jgi:hypothetical protein
MGRKFEKQVKELNEEVNKPSTCDERTQAVTSVLKRYHSL